VRPRRGRAARLGERPLHARAGPQVGRAWLLGRTRGVGWPGEGAGRGRKRARGEELGRGVERGNGPRWAGVRGQV
jgi:hypothetical protein